MYVCTFWTLSMRKNVEGFIRNSLKFLVIVLLSISELFEELCKILVYKGLNKMTWQVSSLTYQYQAMRKSVHSSETWNFALKPFTFLKITFLYFYNFHLRKWVYYIDAAIQKWKSILKEHFKVQVSDTLLFEDKHSCLLDFSLRISKLKCIKQ